MYLAMKLAIEVFLVALNSQSLFFIIYCLKKYKSELNIYACLSIPVLDFLALCFKDLPGVYLFTFSFPSIRLEINYASQIISLP